MTPLAANLTPLNLELQGPLHPTGSDPQPSNLDPRFVSRPRPSREESQRILEEMAALSSGQSLPVDFSTADIYD